MITKRGRGRFAGLLAAVVAAGTWVGSPAGAVAEGEPQESGTMGKAEPAMEAPEATEGSVPRASFTRAIADREPTDRIEVLQNDTQQVYYFTELQGLEGRTVTHRWEHDGEVKAEVPFQVGGPRWRVYSSKNLDPSWVGDWTVSVVDESGRVLRQDRFRYQAEEPEAAPAAPAPDVP